MQHDFIHQLEWRYAVKAFDPNKKVLEADLEKLLEAIHLAPSSFGLQPYHVFVISNDEVKTQLRSKGFNQPQFTNCSHIFVFATRSDLNQRIDDYFEIASEGDAEKRDQMASYEAMMRSFAEGKSMESIFDWADRQAYIALGFALAACAELGIDSCPMEGFSTYDFDAILELPENMKSVVCMTIGYRKEEPHRPKVRFTNEDLFTLLS